MFYFFFFLYALPPPNFSPSGNPNPLSSPPVYSLCFYTGRAFSVRLLLVQHASYSDGSHIFLIFTRFLGPLSVLYLNRVCVSIPNSFFFESGTRTLLFTPFCSLFKIAFGKYLGALSKPKSRLPLQSFFFPQSPHYPSFPSRLETYKAGVFSFPPRRVFNVEGSIAFFLYLVNQLFFSSPCPGNFSPPFHLSPDSLVFFGPFSPFFALFYLRASQFLFLGFDFPVGKGFPSSFPPWNVCWVGPVVFSPLIIFPSATFLDTPPLNHIMFQRPPRDSSRPFFFFSLCLGYAQPCFELLLNRSRRKIVSTQLFFCCSIS